MLKLQMNTVLNINLVLTKAFPAYPITADFRGCYIVCVRHVTQHTLA